MTILQVALGHGWLEEIVKGINTALAFAPPATIHVRSCIRYREPLSGQMHANSFDASSKTPVSIAGFVSVLSMFAIYGPSLDENFIKLSVRIWSMFTLYYLAL